MFISVIFVWAAAGKGHGRPHRKGAYKDGYNGKGYIRGGAATVVAVGTVVVVGLAVVTRKSKKKSRDIKERKRGIVEM